MKEYVGLLGETIRKEQNEDFIIEVVGTLGNLNITDIDYVALLKEYDLVNWIKAMLQPGTKIYKVYRLCDKLISIL